MYEIIRVIKEKDLFNERSAIQISKTMEICVEQRLENPQLIENPDENHMFKALLDKFIVQ